MKQETMEKPNCSDSNPVVDVSRVRKLTTLDEAAKIKRGDSVKEAVPFRVCSLFCGAGGTDLGFVGGFDHLGIWFDKLNFEVVWANDIDPDAVATYKANQSNFLGAHPVHAGDVRKVDIAQVPDFDVLLAGFPCQPFSNAGNRKGVSDDRGTLFEEVHRFIKTKTPMAFVLENVKGILSIKMPDGSLVVDEIVKRLCEVETASGGKVRYRIASPTLVKANEVGVPQQRQRVFIVGIREDLGVTFDWQTVMKFASPEAVSKTTLKHVLQGVKKCPQAKEVWAFSPQAAKMIPLIKRSWKDIPYDELPERLKKIRDDMVRYRSPNFYRRFGIDEVNGTITASAQPENCGIIHPKEDRRYSVREVARIQSFPDQFIFFGRSIAEKYKVIGNAVPPVLAHTIAQTLLAALPTPLTIKASAKTPHKTRSVKAK
jgi:DNA (cytosine-5)-methyltransferase 1